MRVVKRVISSIAVIPLLISLFIPLSVNAASYEIDNDGTVYSNPYGDSGLPSSFEGVSYVDCYLPYSMTLEEIGGLSNQQGHSMPSYYYDYHVGDYVNYEGDMYGKNYWGSFSCDGNYNIGTHEYESDTGCSIIKDSNGTKYYVMAVQGFFFKGDGRDLTQTTGGAVKYQGSGEYLDYKRTIIDVILTDGTVIHFVAGCFNSLEHTNGTIPELDGQGQDGRYYANGMSPLNYEQYRHLFQAEGGNCIELWGKAKSASKFASKYGLSTSGDGVHIAYYRVYDAKIEDAPKPAITEAKEVSYQLGVSGVTSKKDGNTPNGTGLTLMAEDLRKDESYFLGDVSELSERSIALPKAEYLRIGDRQQIYNWKTTIDYLQQDKAFNFMRALVMFVGILVIVYSTLLFIAFQFDKINNFIDICLVEKITLGKLRTSPDDTSTYNQEVKKGQPKIINQRDVIVASITGIMLGVLLLTGKLYQIIWGVTELVKALL